MFALLGVGFSRSRRIGQKQSESATREIIHTPASLFARLRKDLRDRRLVHEISNSSDLEEIQPGEFVEFEATLRRVPLIELLSAFSQIMSLMEQVNKQTTRQRQDLANVGRRIGINVRKHKTEQTA